MKKFKSMKQVNTLKGPVGNDNRNNLITKFVEYVKLLEGLLSDVKLDDKAKALKAEIVELQAVIEEGNIDAKEDAELRAKEEARDIERFKVSKAARTAELNEGKPEVEPTEEPVVEPDVELNEFESNFPVRYPNMRGPSGY
jgi:uncharacterized phage protein gp47/JayE